MSSKEEDEIVEARLLNRAKKNREGFEPPTSDSRHLPIHRYPFPFRFF